MKKKIKSRLSEVKRKDNMVIVVWNGTGSEIELFKDAIISLQESLKELKEKE